MSVSPMLYRDLEYARFGQNSLLLDIYLPTQASDPFPLIVWVHGGAFRMGDKGNSPAERMVARGYAVASINYRLSQEALFPAQIEDCKAAVRWLRAHAAQYNLNPGRIGAWGSSAGGHLVAMLGTTGHMRDLDTGAHLAYSSQVQAVCDFFGPTDFLQMDAAGSDMHHDAPDSPESPLIGGAIQEYPDRVARANPITYVTPAAPPFLIAHGDCDPLVPHHQSELLYAALQRAGVQVTFHTVRGAGHGFEGPEIDQLVDAFFDRHLKQG
jgi:acetyl esterase/lipase